MVTAALALRRRLLQNPSYYDLGATDPESVSAFLSDMVERTLATLQVRPACGVGRMVHVVARMPQPWLSAPRMLVLCRPSAMCICAAAALAHTRRTIRISMQGSCCRIDECRGRLCMCPQRKCQVAYLRADACLMDSPSTR